jgi:hypothetical protein
MREQRQVGPPPLSTFTGVLKQVATADMCDRTRRVFTYFFPRFETLNWAPGESETPERPILWLTGQGGLDFHYGGVRQRRFAGDHTLPRGSYWTVHSALAEGTFSAISEFREENNQIIRELFAYNEPYCRLDPELLDSTVDIEKVKKVQEIGLAKITRPSLLHIIYPHFKGVLPTALGIDPGQTTIIEYPLRISPVTIPDVLDLRLPPAAAWLVDFCVSRNSTVARVLDLKNPPSPAAYFAGLLYFLLDQGTGGELPLLQDIGAWLRSNGVAGLVFPSARCDSGVVIQDGELTSWWGFNYVDYRGAPPVELNDNFGAIRVPNMERIQFKVAPEPERWGSWNVEGVLRRQGLVYKLTKQEFEGASKKTWTRLCDGSIYPSDPLPKLLGARYVYYMNVFPCVGHLFAHYLGGHDVLGDPAEFTYDGEAWYLSRANQPGGSQLLCPRCLSVLIIDDEAECRNLTSCASCGLGDRGGHPRWTPGNDWTGTPSLAERPA